MNKQWKIDSLHPRVERLAKEWGVPKVVAQILANRGFSIEKGARFLNPTLSKMHEPYMMKNMKKAVKRIDAAKQNNEKIMIHGDYDVDGITSTALMLKYFDEIGVESFHYIPNRLVDDYGLNMKGVDYACKQGANLIITVDCGISAVNEVEEAKRKGLDIIITDHHEPRNKLPDTLVLNPKIDNYPFKELAGVGVALKLVQGLMKKYGGTNLDKYLKLACIGTVTDVVPLVDENRIIVKNGLTFLNYGSDPGLDALKRVSSVEQVRAGDIGFKLGPRLNASGRLGDAQKALELLMCDNYDRAYEIARVLNAKNKERQRMEKDVYEEAVDIIEDEEMWKDKFIVVGNEGWHKGLIGIVASRITEKYYRPTIVISKEKNIGYGSGRSIPEFDLFGGLSKLDKYFETFGGHKMAAGLSIKIGNVDRFREEIIKYANTVLTEKDIIPKLDVNAIVKLSEINDEVIQKFQKLEPFGYGNKKPVICSTHLATNEVEVLKDKHIKLDLKDDTGKIEAIGFNMKEDARKIIDHNCAIHAAYVPTINEWNGRRSIQLKLKDIKVGNITQKSWFDKIKEYIQKSSHEQ